MARQLAVNWDVEIAFLRDMGFTGCQSHRIAGEAIWNGIAAASEKEGGALEQKVLTTKMAAEEVGALEDLGALVWSVANRCDEGVLRNYLNCPPKNIRQVYEQIQTGVEALRLLLRLPSDDTLSRHLDEADVKVFATDTDELGRVLRVAAGDYLALNGAIVRTYNKIKHGFVIVQRLDWLIPGQTPRTNWEQHVNVITGVARNGSVRYTDLERSAGMLETLMKVIEMCAKAWQGLAALLIWLHERKVPLDLTN